MMTLIRHQIPAPGFGATVTRPPTPAEKTTTPRSAGPTGWEMYPAEWRKVANAGTLTQALAALRALNCLDWSNGRSDQSLELATFSAPMGERMERALRARCKPCHTSAGNLNEPVLRYELTLALCDPRARHWDDYLHNDLVLCVCAHRESGAAWTNFAPASVEELAALITLATGGRLRVQDLLQRAGTLRLE